MSYVVQDSSAYKFIHHFIPHPYHKTRAKLLSNTSLIMYSLVMIVALGFLLFIPQVYPGVLGYASDIRVKELFEITNATREEAGLSSLRLNPTLSKAALQKAHHMFENDYWAHVSPEGVEPWYFILDEGYDYSYAGENLAKNFNTSKEVVAAWYQSPSHKDNLLSTNYDEVGYAVVDGVLEGYETTLVVQMFGRPRNSTIASEEEELSLLEEFEQLATSQSNVQVPATNSAVNTSQSAEVIVDENNNPANLPVNISAVTKIVTVAFGLFLVTLLILDIYHTKKKGILRFTGHTLAHIIFLVIMVAAVIFIIKPGTVL